MCVHIEIERCALGCMWVCVHEGWKLSTGEVIEELAGLGGMVFVYLTISVLGEQRGESSFWGVSSLLPLCGF